MFLYYRFLLRLMDKLSSVDELSTLSYAERAQIAKDLLEVRM